MSLTSKNQKVNSYFRILKNWDTKSKKDLITKLKKSIHNKNEDAHDFSSCFSAWKDDRSAEDIINEIRNSRVNAQEIESL